MGSDYDIKWASCCSGFEKAIMVSGNEAVFIGPLNGLGQHEDMLFYGYMVQESWGFGTSTS